MSFFFFNDTATTEIYTLSLHDALPISFRLVSDCTHHGGGAEDHLLGWQVNNRCHSCWVRSSNASHCVFAKSRWQLLTVSKSEVLFAQTPLPSTEPRKNSSLLQGLVTAHFAAPKAFSPASCGVRPLRPFCCCAVERSY